MAKRFTLKTAERLAVSYSGYNEAREKNDWNGIFVWGKNLVELQASHGVTLSPSAKDLVQAAWKKLYPDNDPYSFS